MLMSRSLVATPNRLVLALVGAALVLALLAAQRELTQRAPFGIIPQINCDVATPRHIDNAAVLSLYKPYRSNRHRLVICVPIGVDRAEPRAKVQPGAGSSPDTLELVT